MKAQFLVIAIMAALVAATAFHLCYDCGNAQKERSTADRLTEAATSCQLPDLSEFVPPSQASAPEDKSDNTTATVTSGSAVKASFTVVTQPATNQKESMAAEGQAIPNNQSQAAFPVRPKSGGLTAAWTLLTAVLSAGIMAVGVVAFRYVQAKWPPPSS